jgi:hypothetical protein
MESTAIMRVRLTRKFALSLDDVDLSKISVGQEVDLPARSAALLIAEGWAERVDGTPLRGPSMEPIISTG